MGCVCPQELLVPHDCPGRVKPLHPIPAPELQTGNSSAPRLQPGRGEPAVSTAACVPSCREGLAAGRHQYRASPACIPGSRRAAAPANSAQTGAAAKPLSFPLRPFISTASERLSAMLRRGKGEKVLRLLGQCGAALREPGTDILVPPGKAPAWGKAAFPHR